MLICSQVSNDSMLFFSHLSISFWKFYSFGICVSGPVSSWDLSLVHALTCSILWLSTTTTLFHQVNKKLVPHYRVSVSHCPNHINIHKILR